MLTRMILHTLLAAVVIGALATVYQTAGQNAGQTAGMGSAPANVAELRPTANRHKD